MRRQLRLGEVRKRTVHPLIPFCLFVTPTTRTSCLSAFDGPFHSSQYRWEIEPGTVLMCIAITQADHDNGVNRMALVMRPGQDRPMWVSPFRLKPFKVRHKE